MSITDKLNQIIIKYRIDRHYPGFQKKLKAEKIICDLFRQEPRKIVVVSTLRNPVYYVKTLVDNFINVRMLWIKETSDITDLDIDSDEVAYIVSFQDQNELERLFERQGIAYVNLFTELRKYDLEFKRDIYCVTELEAYNNFDVLCSQTWDKAQLMLLGEILQLEFWSENNNYLEAENSIERKTCLEKMLFIALYLKNFVEAERVKELLLQENTELHICEAWEEIENLLIDTKRLVKSRSQKDVILIWMDALGYEEIEDMPYLESIKENSVSFTNAYTITAITRPTMKAIYLQQDLLNDCSWQQDDFSYEESEIFTYLDQKGYEIKINSDQVGYFSKIKGEQQPLIMGRLTPASLHFWYTLEALLNTDAPCFIHSHMIAEIHDPSMSLKRMEFGRTNSSRQRTRIGKQELDEQMAFYSDFFGENAIRIYMSDHGRGFTYEKRFHICMNICYKKMRNRKIEALFSLIDFTPLLKQILETEELDEKTIARQYVKIQEQDLYNIERINTAIENKRIHYSMFGGTGIVTEKDMYMKFSFGKEWAIKRGENRTNTLLGILSKNQIEEGVDIERLRELAGNYPDNVIYAPKYKHSLRLREIYRRFEQKSEPIIRIINQTISSYEDNSVLLRMGGVHSKCLYDLLTTKNKNKILGFVDNSPKCICVVFGKPIFSADKVSEAGAKAILLSSYRYLEDLKAEAAAYPKELQIIDIYEAFKEEGFVLQNEFFSCMGLEDADWEYVKTMDVDKAMQDRMLSW